jgi:hypothetical protein
LPLLAGLAIALGASYGQVALNDAMIARYVPGPLRVKAVSIRYFIGFGASGFAVPLIALLYGVSGSRWFSAWPPCSACSLLRALSASRM